MRPDRFRQIGFSQRIRLEWLETTANLVLAGNDHRIIFDALADLLKDKVSIGGDAERGNREKVITILMKIWVIPTDDLHDLHLAGLKLLRELPVENHLVLHWGMSMAAYPFFGAVAADTGRLLRLQGSASAAHVQRRIREQYGERETVSRAARRILRSFVDWDVIKESNTKGVYSAGQLILINDAEVILWLIQSLLHTHESGMRS